MRAYLIRHGQTAWNVIGRAQGHTDTPLDDVGLAQAAAVARAFEGVEIGEILTSDLSRARVTAEAIAARTGAVCRATPSLRERSFGEWEGMPYEELRNLLRDRAHQAGLDEFEAAPPGGESLRDVWGRLDAVCERLASSTSPLVVVTHGGTCGLLVARLIHATVMTSRSLRFGNTAITELHRRPDGFWVIDRFADTTHLDTPSAPMIDSHVASR
ncbi:MAG TPA: histidine phosphatase family protein [Fimbriimonadaceae bacterium]|nr:histidine phosphatase family protein [Fimbriimonadaceae bacterium]